MTSDSAKTERTTRRANLDHFEKVLTRIAVALVIAGPVLGVIAIALGSAEIFPYEYTVTVALTVLLVPIGAALLIGAVGGLYIMGGPKVAPLGVIFVAGFGLLVYGLVDGRPLLTIAGALLLALSCTIFFILGYRRRTR